MRPPASLLNWEASVSDLIQKGTPQTKYAGLNLYREDIRDKLLNYLSAHYPSLPPLLGKEVWIKEVVNPYIDEHLPKDWSIPAWAGELLSWLQRNNKAKICPLLLPLAELEKLNMECFFSPSLPIPTADKIAVERLQLQPHVRTIISTLPLLNCREKLLDGQNVSKTLPHNKNCLFLTLNEEGNVTMFEMSPDENEFFDACLGHTLNEALLNLSDKNPQLLERATPHIGQWAAGWIQNNLLAV